MQAKVFGEAAVPLKFAHLVLAFLSEVGPFSVFVSLGDERVSISTGENVFGFRRCIQTGFDEVFLVR